MVMVTVMVVGRVRVYVIDFAIVEDVTVVVTVVDYPCLQDGPGQQSHRSVDRRVMKKTRQDRKPMLGGENRR